MYTIVVEQGDAVLYALTEEGVTGAWKAYNQEVMELRALRKALYVGGEVSDLVVELIGDGTYHATCIHTNTLVTSNNA
jgi:hypothetical protein